MCNVAEKFSCITACIPTDNGQDNVDVPKEDTPVEMPAFFDGHHEDEDDDFGGGTPMATMSAGNLAFDEGGIEDPGIELFEWMLLQVWPKVNEVAKGIVKDVVEPQFDKELAKFGAAGKLFLPIKFSEFHLGDTPPTITKVKAYRQSANEHFGIECDCTVTMDITPNINLVIRGHDVGVSRLQFEGFITCIFKPLLNKKPVLGGAQIFLLRRPVVDFDLSGTMQGLNGSLVHRIMKKVVLEQICKKMALPNRFNIQVVKEWDMVEDIVDVQNPRPTTIVRVRVKSASNLPNADIQLTHMLGLTTKRTGSDPYAMIKIGAEEFRTDTLGNTCDPVWENGTATGDFPVYNMMQEVELDVYDDDYGMGKDDHLVGTKMFVCDLLKFPSHSLVVKPHPKKPDSTPANAKQNPAQKVLSKVKSLMKKDEKEEDPAILEIDVNKLRLVACTPQALEKARKIPFSSSEALLAVSVYGIAPVGARKSIDDTSTLVIRTTFRKDGKDSTKKTEAEPRVTKKAKVRVGVPVPDGVDRSMVNMLQNMHFMHPELTYEKIADVMEIDADTVSKVLAMKKLMPIYYNEMYYFFVPNVNADTVLFEILGAPLKSAKAKDRPVIASHEVPVKAVLEGKRTAVTKTYLLTEPAKTEEEFDQSYEVATKMQLWALELQ